MRVSALYLLLFFSAALVISEAQDTKVAYEYEIIDSGPIWLIKVHTRSEAGDFTTTTTADKSAYSYAAVKNRIEGDKANWLSKHGIEYTPEIMPMHEIMPEKVQGTIEEITAKPEKNSISNYFIALLVGLVMVLFVIVLLRWYK